MKKFICLFLLIVPIFIFESCEFSPAGTAGAQTEFRTLYHDSINDIAGTDTTIYWPVRGNSPWTVNVNATGTITGNGGRIYIMESIDGTYWTHLCTPDTSGNLWCDTVKTGTQVRLSGTYFPAKYVGVKLTKGTCKGKIKVQYSMKKPD